MPKRLDYINWDEYFMSLAIISSMRSKDPNTQVGACIVDVNNNVLSLGYNGTPIGFSDDEFPWERSNDDPIKTKYPYVCHSELNAVLNAARNGVKLFGATLYVTLFPCNECTKSIIQSGIKKIVYLDDKYHNEPMTVVSRRMLDKTGVIYEQYELNNKELKFTV